MYPPLVNPRLRFDVDGVVEFHYEVEDLIDYGIELAACTGQTVEFELNYENFCVRVKLKGDSPFEYIVEACQAVFRGESKDEAVGPYPKKPALSGDAKDAAIKMHFITRFLLADPNLSDEDINRIWNALPGGARVKLQAQQLAELAVARANA